MGENNHRLGDLNLVRGLPPRETVEAISLSMGCAGWERVGDPVDFDGAVQQRH